MLFSFFSSGGRDTAAFSVVHLCVCVFKIRDLAFRNVEYVCITYLKVRWRWRWRERKEEHRKRRTFTKQQILPFYHQLSFISHFHLVEWNEGIFTSQGFKPEPDPRRKTKKCQRNRRVHCAYRSLTSGLIPIRACNHGMRSTCALCL